jgi:hypothetical protein
MLLLTKMVNNIKSITCLNTCQMSFFVFDTFSHTNRPRFTIFLAHYTSCHISCLSLS